MTAFVSLKVPTIRPFRGKKNPSKIKISNAIFKVKTDLIYQSILCFSHAFEIFIPRLIISFGKLTERVSLNVATNGSLTGRKTSQMTILRLLF